MIFIDSNVPMYLIGKAHPNKQRVIALVTQLTNAAEPFVTSAEVFQEIIHRYRAIHDPKHLQIAYEALESMVQGIESIGKADTDRALTLAARYPDLSSRDCLHVAVMQRIGCKRVWTFDAGFENVASLSRIY